MKIKTIGIVGLGALGTMYGNFLTKALGKDRVFVLADKDRITRYKNEGIYCNDEKCELSYLDVETERRELDLIIYAVKFSGFESALKETESVVGNHTIMISLLNGISSERMLIEKYGEENVLYCVAQGMDALKTGNQMYYKKMGFLCFGDKDGGYTEQVKAVDEVFCEADLPHELPGDMIHRLWGKLLLNTGVNQAVTVYETNFGGVQKAGVPRDIMIGAMKEVILVARAEGIDMKDEELDYWVNLVDSLNPEGKPSMRQDAEARRYSEVNLFSGTIRDLGRKHGIDTPVNDMLYEKIKKMESGY